METRDKFCFSFGQVERHAVRFGKGRDQEHDERDELRNNEPFERRTRLCVDDAVQIKRSGDHHDTQDRRTHREFVRDHLCRRTQAAHQAVFAVR